MIEAAKKVAEEREVSLSRMVAEYFMALTHTDTSSELAELPPKTRALHGVLRDAPGMDDKAA